MAESVCVVFDGPLPSLVDVAAVMDGIPVVQLQPDQVFVEDERGRAWIWPVSGVDLKRDVWFDGWPPDLVPAEPNGFWIRYRSVPFVKQVTLRLIELGGLCVDTGFGTLYTGECFRHRCANDPDWTWEQYDDAPLPENWPDAEAERGPLVVNPGVPTDDKPTT